MAEDRRGNGTPGGRKGWRDRVAFSLSWNERFAYVPDQVLVLGTLTPEQAAGVRELGLVPEREGLRVGVLSVQAFTRSGDVALDVPLVVRRLQVMGVTAQPNHVFFADANPLGANPFLANPFSANPFLANPFLANPFSANPFLANPFLANPFSANPFLANPFSANPFLANPVWGNPLWSHVWGNPIWTSRVSFETFLATGVRRSTAKPVDAPPDWPAPPQGASQSASDAPKVVVLDTGYSGKETRPPFVPASIDPAALPKADEDIPDRTGQDVNARDGYLDPVAGHGTFIAGLIARLEPTVAVEVRHVVEPEGDVSETTLIQELKGMVNEPGPPDLLNLSLSGYALDDMMALRLAVADLQAKGTVVVASAGNDGVCIPTYPASLPGVISVGAIGPGGPAPFTNWGPWVRACAPGVGVVSSFFNWDGTKVAPPEVKDAEKFSGWAQWDGTSFSAPVVVGALAHEMVARGVTASEAVERLIDAPGLIRIPYLGTVVNVL